MGVFALLELLNKLGGELKPPTKKRLFLKDRAIYYRNTKLVEAELLKIVNDAMGMPWITCIIKNKWKIQKPLKYHPFIQTLDRFMKHSIWEKDQKIHNEGVTERLMMLVTYLVKSAKRTSKNC